MNNQEFGKQLEERTRIFAIRVLKLSASMKYSFENNVIRNQISKSGTSIGANYREANRARSKADFIHKIKICESEANETIYWLEIITELNCLNNVQIDPILNEAKELLALFTSIGIKLKCP